MKLFNNHQNLSAGICVLALGLIINPTTAQATVVRDIDLSIPPDNPMSATGAINVEALSTNLHNLAPQELTIASNRRLHNLVSANEKPQLASLINLDSIPDKTLHNLTNINPSAPQPVITIADNTPIPIPIQYQEREAPSITIPVNSPAPSIPLTVSPAPTTVSFQENDPVNSTPDEPRLITNPEEINFSADVANKNISPKNISNSQEVMASIPIQVDFYNPSSMPPSIEITSPDFPNQFNSPEQYLPDAEKPFNGYIWPAKGTFTSGYGWRWGRMHRGIDVAAPVGTPVVAAADGEVITAGWNSGGFGNLVKIKHPDGSITLYAHNQRLRVRRGQQVRQGQHISDMGSTGFSTGPHLHFEIHRDGKAKDPMVFLPRR
ncbi:MAG: M23 family metallopeptidase [Cyanobacterium sp. T60_A2020_053]|nr:M23 family metallopeptidase [Cyanobacterium sp. T60_A2020_053]